MLRLADAVSAVDILRDKYSTQFLSDDGPSLLADIHTAERFATDQARIAIRRYALTEAQLSRLYELEDAVNADALNAMATRKEVREAVTSLDDDELAELDGEFARRAVALGRPGALSRSHKIVREAKK